MKSRPQRILHVDGDSFFASCEIALDPTLRAKPVFVGGGRRGDGIVIAANYIAKKYGITTGMACFEAKRQCPGGVLVKPHYNEYRRLSLELFQRVRHYTPLLVPTSIDEGFLDFTDSPLVFRCRDAADLVAKMKHEISAEVGIPVTCGLGHSRWMAKLATEKCKPDGFLEVPPTPEAERAFLRDMPIEALAGIAKRRARSLRALGIWTLGDVAKLPLSLIEKRYGIFGLELWLLSNGQFREKLKLTYKPRTCIGSATTLPYDEHDYEAGLLFLLDQSDRLLTTLIRENLKPREMGIYVRFKNLEGDGASIRFASPQFEPGVIQPEVERLYWGLVHEATLPIRQVSVHFWNLTPLNLEPDLFGDNQEFKRRQLHHAMETIEARYGPRRVKSGTRLLLETQAPHLVGDKAKCPFVGQREMELKVSRIPEVSLDPVYEDEWQPLEQEPADESPALPRTWGRSTTRELKLG